ncbi:MAG: proton-conducting transporter membrane subunit [Planctomycetaceae bacterium]|nr:proton-conducting transporter membrane subunit [Planctomycetaceae bacterium]
MSEILNYLAPRLVMLLTVSPWIGVAAVGLLHRSGSASVLRSARFNAGVTAVFASVLGGYVIGTGIEHASGGEGFQAIRAIWKSGQPGATGLPWSIEFGFSVGVDSLNWPVLVWIPWLTAAVFLMLSERDAARPGFCAGLLAIEGALLCVFAAQDALTFCMASEGSLVLFWLMTGWYGGADRRLAAGRYFRWQYTANLLWTLGIFALGLAALWVQQEVRRDARVVRFGWGDLAETLQRFTDRYIGSIEYWNGAALLLVVLIGATVVRAGLVPGHHWLTALLQEAPAAVAVLHLGAAGLIGGYAYLRCLAPLTASDQWGAGWLSCLGAISALAGGLLSLAQTDLRKFAACWWLSLQGCVWVGMGTSVPIAQTSGWWALQSAVASAAGLMFIVQALEQRFDVRGLDAIGGLAQKHPRLAICGCLVLLPPLGSPSVARGVVDQWGQLTTLSAAPGLWWLALAGWLCTSWATIWLLERLFIGRWRGPLREPEFFADDAAAASSPDAPPWVAAEAREILVQDLSWRECQAIGLTLAVPAISWWAWTLAESLR